MGAIVFTQNSYRFYNDDGQITVLGSASGAGAINTAITYYNLRNLRLRTRFSANSAPTTTFFLKYSVDGGAYANLPTSGGTYVNCSDSGYYSNQAAITSANFKLSGGAGSAVQGYAMDTGYISPSFLDSGYTECEWCFKFTSASAGHVITFQTHASSSDSWSYTTTPSVTVTPQKSLIISGAELVISGSKLIVKGA